MALIISTAVIPDIKKKRKLTTGFMARKKEKYKTSKIKQPSGSILYLQLSSRKDVWRHVLP